MKQILNFINGEYVRNTSGKTFQDINPVNGSDIVNKLADAWKAGAATSPALLAFENIGADIKVNTPQQFAEFIRTENLRWGSLIQKLGIKLD